MDRATKTLLVAYFHIFIGIYPTITIYNLSHLKCIMVGEEVSENDSGIWQGTGKNETAALGFAEP